MGWDIHYANKKFRVFSTVTMGYITAPMNHIETFCFLFDTNYAGHKPVREGQEPFCTEEEAMETILFTIRLAQYAGDTQWRPYPNHESYSKKSTNNLPDWLKEGIEREERRNNPNKYNTAGAGI